MIAFRFREHLRGTFWMLDAPLDERAIDLVLEATSLPLRAFARERKARLKGRAALERTAHDVPVEGTLTFRLRDEQCVRYEVTFTTDDGRRLRLRGDKDLGRWYAPADAVSTLPASLYDENGREVGRAVVRWDVRAEAGTLLKSFRLRLALS